MTKQTIKKQYKNYLFSHSEKKAPKEELVDDVMQILNVHTAKMNGLRKYGKL